MAWRTRRIIDLARAVVQMDVVISVDTMAAHLAASLRMPVCLLLEPAGDWRWIGRADPPYYPEVRVFQRRHHWSDVIEEVSERLRLCLKSKAVPQHLLEKLERQRCIGGPC
jgi:ADP-heptose:LPS heptosyltransferase